MWMLFLFIRILCITCVCAYEHQDYSPGYSPGKEEPEVGVVEDLIQGVSSVDELLELLYPAYRLVQQCLRRKAESTTPHHYTDDPMWGSSRQAALFKTDGTLEVIMEEIQRTKCSPREVCLEVAKEFPESTSRFYVPRCVSAHRCGGCCNSEAWQCTNTSYTVMNKTLLEISPQKSVVMVPVVNHTSCECQQKRPKHSIIRRSLDLLPTLCPQPDEPCDAGLVWDELACECVPVLSLLLDQQLEPRDPALLELCGPNKVLDEESCECACQNGLTDASCEPGWRLDEGSCECVCEVEASGAQPACPPNQSWDPELCACVCLTQCPPSQPLDPEMCQCQCRESEQTCLLQGKRFKADGCSCYRLPCKDPHKKCQMGYYYSHFVCQCIPNFLRSSERELT